MSPRLYSGVPGSRKSQRSYSTRKQPSRAASAVGEGQRGEISTQTDLPVLDPAVFKAKTPLPASRIKEIFDVEELGRYRRFGERAVKEKVVISNREMLEGMRQSIKAQEKVDFVYNQSVWRSQYLLMQLEQSREKQREVQEDKERQNDAFQKQQAYACGTKAHNLFNLRKDILV